MLNFKIDVLQEIDFATIEINEFLLLTSISYIRPRRFSDTCGELR